MQKLHLVMGGRVKDPQGTEFVDLKAIDMVGVFPDYKPDNSNGHQKSLVNQMVSGLC